MEHPFPVSILAVDFSLPSFDCSGQLNTKVFFFTGRLVTGTVTSYERLSDVGVSSLKLTFLI